MDEILKTFKGLDALVKAPVENSELLFNVAQFKSKKQVIFCIFSSNLAAWTVRVYYAFLRLINLFWAVYGRFL